MASLFYLNQEGSSGATREDEFIKMSKMRGKKHEALTYPDLPPVFSPIVSSYSDLNGDFSHQEIKAYKEVTGIELDLFDISLIKDIKYIMTCVENGNNTEEILKRFGYVTN